MYEEEEVMCKCNPAIRTMYCGRLGCEWPKKEGTRVNTEYIHPSLAIDSDSPVHKNRRPVHSSFRTDENGNPTGGISVAEGISVEWQNGVQEPNGAILEDYISIAIDRLRFFQGQADANSRPDGKFACRENALAITHLEEALHWLSARTLERRRRGVEGSYEK